MNLELSGVKVWFYIVRNQNLFLQKTFFRIKVGNVHPSSDVTMVDHVLMFKADLENTFSSRRLSITDMT